MSEIRTHQIHHKPYFFTMYHVKNSTVYLYKPPKITLDQFNRLKPITSNPTTVSNHLEFNSRLQ